LKATWLDYALDGSWIVVWWIGNPKHYSTLFDYENMNEMFVLIKIYTLDSA